MSIKAAPMILGGLFLGIIAAIFGRKAHASETLALPPPKPEPIRLPEIIVTPDDDVDEDTEADIHEAVNDSATSLPTSFTSVISGVSDAQWTSYVKKQKQGKLNTVTKSNNLGLFMIGYPMLKTLGYVTNLHKTTLDGREVWTGDFVPPLTQEAFLRNALVQYEAFAKMSALQASQIRAKYGDVISGSKGAITLSGLLNVSKVAGMGGLDAWLKEPSKRKESTTNEFNAFNGMF